MKKIAFLFSLITLAFTAKAQGPFALTQQNNEYQYSVDLTKLENDKLKIELIVPVMDKDTVLFRFPAMVPGTYKVYDFGRYTSDFLASDQNGKALNTEHTDANSWKITGAKKLVKVTYTIEDTWDSKVKDAFVFEPAGTNFQKDTCYVINNHGFFGYFEGMKRTNFSLYITHPEGFYGATGLSNVKHSKTTDWFSVPNYMELIDGPIMYTRPDTSHLQIGDSDILISVYSPNKLVSSKFVADSLRILLDQQRQYLGGTLPVKNYAFLIYLNDNPKGYKSGSYGALEHSYSSMYTLLEMKPEIIAQTIENVASHEFFHIVTPLNIHSEEIGDFDFNKPAMSQHLWMYEGMTEYAARHVQVKYGTQSLADFLEVIREKMFAADDYSEDLSFTQMSKGCLDKYEDQYGNVYAKGMLISLCLDIRLRQLSDGQYGTQELMRDLSKKYGKDRSFKDDSLFSDIVKLTYPEIGDFFNRFVIGTEPLPFLEMLGAVGIEYKRRKTVEQIDPFGGFAFFLDGDNNIRFFPNEVNDFGREMGYRKGDMLVAINGVKVNTENIQLVLDQYKQTAKSGDKLVVTIKRIENGKWKKMKLKGKLRPVSVTRKHHLMLIDNPTEEQIKLRKSWINK
jgi:predicted metalloprotease with PDZ domain